MFKDRKKSKFEERLRQAIHEQWLPTIPIAGVRVPALTSHMSRLVAELPESATVGTKTLLKSLPNDFEYVFHYVDGVTYNQFGYDYAWQQIVGPHYGARSTSVYIAIPRVAIVPGEECRFNPKLWPQGTLAPYMHLYGPAKPGAGRGEGAADQSHGAQST